MMRVVLFISHSAMILLHIAEIVFCCLAVVLLSCFSCLTVIPFQVICCFAVALLHVVGVIAVITVVSVVSVMTVSAVILLQVFYGYIWSAVMTVILFHE